MYLKFYINCRLNLYIMKFHSMGVFGSDILRTGTLFSCQNFIITTRTCTENVVRGTKSLYLFSKSMKNKDDKCKGEINMKT